MERKVKDIGKVVVRDCLNLDELGQFILPRIGNNFGIFIPQKNADTAMAFTLIALLQDAHRTLKMCMIQS